MTTTIRPHRNRSRKPACGRALADHQFIGCLERTAATETWESQTADGRHWLVKVLFNVAGPDPKHAEAVSRLQALTHPNLVPTRVMPGGPGCLVLAADYTSVTLLDFLKQHQMDGSFGIPRQPLLRWLRQAATTLEEVAAKQGVSHLGLSPRHLLRPADTLLIADYGLVQLMWLPTGQFAGQVAARYSAPELPDRYQNGPACDQFSLAAIYQELLTGTPPYRARPAGAPDLSPLPESDRKAIACALDFDPNRRFPSCVDLIDALENAGVVKAVVPSATPPVAPATKSSAPRVRTVTLPEEPESVVAYPLDAAAETPTEPIATDPVAADAEPAFSPTAEPSREDEEEIRTFVLESGRPTAAHDIDVTEVEKSVLTESTPELMAVDATPAAECAGMAGVAKSRGTVTLVPE